MSRLTDALINRLPLPAKGNKVVYDDDVKGFGVRVTAGGSRSFILNYVTKGGRERRYTIGRADEWNATDARAKARKLRAQIADGGDPLRDIEDERAAPTVADLIKRYRTEHLPRLRDSTCEDYERMIKVWIAPHFGTHMKVADVAFEDIDALHRKISKAGHPYRANRTVAVLSKIFNLAIRWNMRADNPCKGIERNTEHSRRRYLKGEELGRLTEALAKHPDQQAADIFRILLLTGARRGEVLTMRWGDVDLGTGMWSKPATSTKQNRPHDVPLSAPARALLSEIRGRAGKAALGTYVFPGIGAGGCRVTVNKDWRKLLKVAGIKELRIHDLRHSFASQIVSFGGSLPMIGALLGHSNPATTQRYAHMFVDPMREAADKVGALIENANKPAPDPVQLRPKRGRP